MTKLRRKLLLSVLTLALTFIALGSTTFAWFTTGTQVTASPLTGSVQAGEGIDATLIVPPVSDSEARLNYKGATWTTTINLTDVPVSNLKFKDLTSTDGVVIKNSEGNTVTAASNQYVEFDLFVRAMTKKPNAINLSSVKSTTDSFSWTPDAPVEGYLTMGTAKTWHPLNALRVSFVATGVTVDSNPTTKVNVIEWTIGDYHNGSFDATENGLSYKYALAKKYDVKPLANNEGNNPATTKINALEQAVANVNLIAGLEPFAEYPDAGNTYYIYKITVRMWMEGWDGDCINAVLGKSIDFGFGLTATFPAA